MKALTFLLALVLSTCVPCSSQQATSARQGNREGETASQQRNQFQEKTQAKLRKLDQEIEALNAKAAKQGKEVRKDLDRQMAELERKRQVLQQQLEKFKNSSQEAWRDMKPGIDAAMKDLELAYKRAASHFK